MIPTTALVNSLPRNILGKKHTRAGKPKSRGGCISCKLRHRKCNEEKPICNQCRKSARVCHYDIPKEKQHGSIAPPKRTILPRQETLDVVATRALHFRPRASHLEAEEAPYFDLFRAQMLQDFTYTPCTKFWNRVIPRESMGDECVRWSVLSIGALMLSLRSSNPEPTVKLLEERGGGAYQVAMAYHAKATTTLHMRMRQEFHTISRRNVLINMFLLFLFELLIGNTKGADQLLTSSVELLKQKRDQLVDEMNSQYHRQDLHSYVAPSNDEGLDQAERILPRFQIFLSLNTPFFPMQKACWSRLQSRPIPGGVPGVDTDMHEFGAMWNSFITRAVIFIVKVMQRHQYGYHTNDFELHLAHRAIFLERLQGWEEAILLKLEAEKNPIICQFFNTFYMGQKAVFILMSCCFDATEMSYDQFSSKFREIASTASSLGGTLKRFSHLETALDIYTLPVLNFVSQKCRDKVIRSEALDSFEKMTSSSFNWDTRASLLARRQLMALEEESRDATGHIPASGRYVWTSASWETGYSSLNIVFTPVASNSDGTRKERRFKIFRSDLENRTKNIYLN
ncbi:hypothetical protein M441DRAFT_165805 [Trichoderma asperellum CBS 433.97]|uniref:Zn(2)-C6 fungal-type domain-containing protein n=1 Tax=Trichoderma asperellum (strain ATCC 204424 / CBS 433.97 / NBRC 101777) TaxID=1042311 RepID=A0A2T3ZCH7_TRIA4|nr:hypothetical protein M441DRAFT_165805 [Trichoderma asperellum CBS 433.97]PTB42502.1 hypothetical protein M441DRAFT_165805 [Trichoderma asperellum CBS 433.97]